MSVLTRLMRSSAGTTPRAAEQLADALDELAVVLVSASEEVSDQAHWGAVAEAVCKARDYLQPNAKYQLSAEEAAGRALVAFGGRLHTWDGCGLCRITHAVIGDVAPTPQGGLRL